MKAKLLKRKDTLKKTDYATYCLLRKFIRNLFDVRCFYQNSSKIEISKNINDVHVDFVMKITWERHEVNFDYSFAYLKIGEEIFSIDSDTAEGKLIRRRYQKFKTWYLAEEEKERQQKRQKALMSVGISYDEKT